MNNNIVLRQNEDVSIKKLAAMRQIYINVGNIDYINFLLSVCIPLLLAVLTIIFDDSAICVIISHLLILFMMVIPFVIERKNKSNKEFASNIMLSFDLYVYDLPWDKKVFGERKDYEDIIKRKSSGYLKKKSHKNALINWFSLNLKDLDNDSAIVECQKESVLWDSSLRELCKVIAIIFTVLIFVSLYLFCSLYNDSILGFFSYIVFLTPIVNWLVKLIFGLSDDIERLNSIHELLYSTKKKSTVDIQLIEKQLTEHRKQAIKIPDLIYFIFKRFANL